MGNPKIYGINFADQRYKALQRLSLEMLSRHFFKFKPYGWEDIDKETLENNSSLFESQEQMSVAHCRHEHGFWFWKPLIIMDSFKGMSEGDILVYSDSGSPFNYLRIPDIRRAFKSNDSLMFIVKKSSKPERQYTKRDLFVGMDCDTAEYTDTCQYIATSFAIRKSKESVSFLNEWSLLCNQKHLISDDANVLGMDNYPEFLDHRHDQSIFSLLCKRHASIVTTMPKQFYFRTKEKWKFFGLNENSLGLKIRVLFKIGYYLNVYEYFKNRYLK